MRVHFLKPAAAAALLTACGSETDSDPIATAPPTSVPAQPPTPPPTSSDGSEPAVAKPPAPAPLVGERLVLAEWTKAENRNACAPLAFASDGGLSGVPRAAAFSGGWAVAFDLPERRSAYGVAGPGLIPADAAPDGKQRDRLIRQWPYLRELRRLPQPAFAGYGLVGARPYPDDRSDGSGMQSLAYVRVGGQACTYNVWSRVSRAHLELLLDNLTLVPRPSR